MNTVLRIKEYIDYKGISIKKFEESVGFSNGAFASQYKNNRNIGSDKIENILSKYPDLSPDWLLTGNGEMLRSSSTPSVPVATPAEQGQGIPLIPIEAMAGYGTGEMQVLEYECDRYVVPAFKDAEFLIQVKGSSMLPKYNSGDIVACKKLPMDQLFFQWNKVYVLDTNQGALIKRVKAGSDDDHLLIVSDNERYEPFELHKKFIHSVAIVIGVIRLE